MKTGSYKIKIPEAMQPVILVILMVAMTCFPYVHDGLDGYFPDLMYHLQRIEAVKDALANGDFPARIYYRFYNGYGYGSPLFYPDVFLVFPAVLRILGVPAIAAWKLFVAFLCAVMTCSTWLSLKFITKDRMASMLGTALIVLSQFYLADIQDRVGLSEYIAYIFLPVLFAAIYDFFKYEGKRIWLFGIAFGGLVLSHTIMTFLAGVFTVICLLIGLVIPKYRKRMLKPFIRLVGCAVMTFCVVGFYFIPLLEQLASGEFYYKEPWALVGDYTEPLYVLFLQTGHFSHIAYVGIGTPILILIVLFSWKIFTGRKYRAAAAFLLAGIVTLIAMTSIVPWHLLNNTIFNMIQFSYRLYPFGICACVVGIMIYFGRSGFARKNNIFCIIMIAITCVFAVIQNCTISSLEETLTVSDEYLEANTGYTGCGEWLPLDIDPAVSAMTADGMVESETSKLELTKEAYGTYSFETDGSENYIVPLMMYKGYAAKLIAENGEETALTVEKDRGLVKVINTTGLEGRIVVTYAGTTVQKLANALSAAAILLIVLLILKKCLYGRGRRKISQKQKAPDM